MYSIIHFICLIIATVIDAVIDNNLIRKKKNVHTIVQYVVREAGFILLTIVFAPNNTYALTAWLLSHIIYWFVFDSVLNLIRRKPITYMSDRGIDQYQRPELLFFILKGIFATVASLYFLRPSLFVYDSGF